MNWTVVCVLVVLVASGSACWKTGDDPEATSIAPVARTLPSPTLTPESTATPTPTSTSSPTPVPTASPTPTSTSSPTPSLVTPSPTPDSVATSTAAYWRTVERNGEIEGYGYVPDFVEMQAQFSDLVARVRHLSVEPSFRINPGADTEYRYGAYVHFSFGIIETLWGNPPGDVVVVEYSVPGIGPTRAQAIEQAKKWIASERDAWWNKQEAIIFLDDPRLVGSTYVSEITTGAHYRFADHFSCGDHDGQCDTWYIWTNDSYPSWVWLPNVGQDASLELPDSERMFHVVVVPYGANTYEHRVAPASLANIKAVLEAHWSKDWVRAEYVARHRILWEAKGSDSYSYVFSGVDDEGHPLFPTQRIVVHNGEAVEAFYTQDYEEGGVVYPAGTRIELRTSPRTIDLPSPTSPSPLMWHLVNMWIRGDQPNADVSFDYEFGYPSATRWRRKNEPDLFLYASEYTPLDN